MPVNQKLVISVCNYLIPEVSQVINAGNYQDVKLHSFVSNCQENSISPSALIEMVSEKDKNQSDIIFFCGSCCSQKIAGNRNVKARKLDQCFELAVNREIVSYYISRGFYIVTNGWLRTYETQIRKWGFEKDAAKSFFRESMKRIILLDTQIPGDYTPQLLALSEYMGLDYEILPVGLSHCKSLMDTEISLWRAENERKSMNAKLSEVTRQSTDYALIISQLEVLVNIEDEKSIIQVGFELLNILFSPSEIYYEKSDGLSEDVLVFNGHFKRNETLSDDGFSIDVCNLHEHLGTYKIISVQFPAYIDEYKKMGRLISQIFGLSIANARKYKTTLDQSEKIKAFSLELQNTINTKDKFFSIISHDLKSPFFTLLGFSNLLIKEINFLISEIRNERTVKIEKYGSIILETSENTYNLLTNLLEWAQSQTGRVKYNPALIVLSDLTKVITGLLRTQAKVKNITLTETISPELKVYGDFNMLMTVIRNLIANAIKYTPENGVITLTAITIEDNVQISVNDTGVGISDENMKNMFLIGHSKSTLGTNREKGTGLGLILCKEFVEKHKGKIWVESKEGIGSTFHFSIPVNDLN
jgi:signal transduction histidine kinase